MTLKEFQAWLDGFMEHVCEEEGMNPKQVARVREKLQEAVMKDQQFVPMIQPYPDTATDRWTIPCQQPYVGDVIGGGTVTAPNTSGEWEFQQQGDITSYGQTSTKAEADQAGRDPTGC